jgi:putative PEP-CTERM system TPR-repeat lipoprotein
MTMPGSVNKLIACYALASSAVLGLAACGQRSSPQALLAEAQQYHVKGDHKAAIIQLKNALQQNDAFVPARTALADIYNSAGDNVSAEKEIRKALSLGLAREEAQPILATALLKQGKFQPLLDETTGAKAPAVLSLRGAAFLSLGKRDEAKQAFEQALAKEPRQAAALVGMARLALLEQATEKAQALAEQAVAAHPNDGEALVFQGDLARFLHQPEVARAAYDKALALDRNNLGALIRKAHLLIESKNFEEGRSVLDTARQINANSWELTYARALLSFSDHKSAAARDDLQALLRVTPDNLPALLLAGAVESALGNLAQAEQDLRKYLESDRRNLYARKLMAAAVLGQSRPREALEWLEPYLKGNQDGAMLTLAGRAYMAAGDYAKAGAIFTQASQLDPKQAVPRASLGVSQLAMGKDEQALAELQAAAELETGGTDVKQLLATVQLQLKQYERALQTVSALEKLTPDNPALQSLKGDAYLGRKDLVQARASFDKALRLKPNYFPALASLVQLDLHAKQPEAAQRRLTAFLAVNPKSVEALTMQSDVARGRGNMAEATEWLQKAVAADPAAAAPAVRLARQYLATNQAQAALTLLRKAQTAHAADAEVLSTLGQVQVSLGDNAGAIETYSKLLNVASSKADVYVRLASAYMAQQNINAAEDMLHRALSVQADYGPAQLAMAALYMRRNKPEAALVIARKLQQGKESAAAGYSMEGDIVMASKPAQALHAYEQAFALNKTAELLIRQHTLLLQTGKEKEAEARMKQWRQAHPNDLETNKYLAELLLQRRDFAAAATALEALQVQAPQDVVVRNNLAWAYHQLKDARAVAAAEKALELGADNAAVLDTVGWIMVEQGKAVRGVQLLQKAVEKFPEESDFRYHLAYGLNVTGDKALARKQVTLALAGDKKFASMNDARALLKQLY